MGHRDVANHRGDHFDGDQPTIFRRAHASVVHSPQNDKRIRDSLTEPNENIAHQEFAQRGAERLDDTNQRDAKRAEICRSIR